MSSTIFSVELKSSEINCLTSKCHSNMGQYKVLHKPLKAKGCVVCHQVINSDVKNKKLPANHLNIALAIDEQQSAVCKECHVEWMAKLNKKNHHHSAIDKNGCTGCHNPHGGDAPKFLKVKPINQELCLSCHKKNENWEKGDKEVAHRAMSVKNKCFNCHEIHASDRPKLLKDEVVKLCSSCHEDTIAPKENGSIHPPVEKGECLKCHSQHYASKEGLLEKNFEGGEEQVKNIEKSFELCLSCHNPFKATQFRNGQKNLHESHTLIKDNAKKRSCSVCHDVHVSSQKKLIKTSFKYKKAMTKIAYAANDQGGNCTTTCHDKRGYNRVNPIENIIPAPVVKTEEKDKKLDK